MKCGLIGRHLGHSYSKVIHNLLGEYEYDLFPMEVEEVVPFIQNGQFQGLNVTIPYKELVLDLCQELDPPAKAIGAVNTMYYKDGILRGTNTDYQGFLYMASQAGISFRGKKVLVLGTGGASRMVQWVLEQEGATQVWVGSRQGPITYQNLPNQAEIIVNTTPVGTYPEIGEEILDLSQFPNCCGVLDLIYNPEKTRLLLDAQDLSIPFSNGLSMLVAQATSAAGYFTGTDKFRGYNQEIISFLKKNSHNIILVGMPGSGKTTLGQMLAERLNMKFADSDVEVFNMTGMRPDEIINNEGEGVFRHVEKQSIYQLAREHGQVIATGGGAVLNPENIKALRQNGTLIWIERNIDDLQMKNRPLSKDRLALEKLYQVREPIYRQCSQYTVENNKPLEVTLEALLSIANGILD